MDDTVLLRVDGLVTRFTTGRGCFDAVNGISLTLRRGEILGLVGESGSGKSVTARSIMRLVPDPPGRIVGGRIELSGAGNLLDLPMREMRRVRGRRIAMAFQDPLSFLNPVLTIGDQITEALLLHGVAASKRQARDKAAALLASVNIESPEQSLKRFPHQFSGGMRQRVLLAIALACEPELLIADEVTTALDVVTQYEVLLLLRQRVAESGLSVIFVTHDLGVAAALCDHIAVMYAGRVMEAGPARAVLQAPSNPYTAALMQAVPRFDDIDRRLESIKGSAPSLLVPPPGCRFHPRCSLARPVCAECSPALERIATGHTTACHAWNPKAGICAW